MDSKLIGGILLIVGTTVGAGMLALPVTTAPQGIILGILTMILCWAVITFVSFLVLEVCMWLPEDSNFISMSRHTIGKWGELSAWFFYLLLLYSAICAYIASSSDVFGKLLLPLHIKVPLWLSAFIVVAIFAAILYRGIRSIDFFNRIMVITLLVVFAIMIFAVSPNIHFHNFIPSSNPQKWVTAILVMIVSLTYSITIPGLRSYFKSDIKKLRILILLGGFFPLLIYIMWILIVMGSVAPQNLYSFAASSHVTTAITKTLAVNSGKSWIYSLSTLFASLCTFTSLLGTSLCLKGFIADGLKIKPIGKANILIVALIFIPPLGIVLFDPKVFVKALGFAGISCVYLGLFLPAVMVWNGRYRKKLSSKESYKVFGEKTLIAMALIVSLILLVWGTVTVI